MNAQAMALVRQAIGEQRAVKQAASGVGRIASAGKPELREIIHTIIHAITHLHNERGHAKSASVEADVRRIAGVQGGAKSSNVV